MIISLSGKINTLTLNILIHKFGGCDTKAIKIPQAEAPCILIWSSLLLSLCGFPLWVCWLPAWVCASQGLIIWGYCFPDWVCLGSQYESTDSRRESASPHRLTTRVCWLTTCVCYLTIPVCWLTIWACYLLCKHQVDALKFMNEFFLYSIIKMHEWNEPFLYSFKLNYFNTLINNLIMLDIFVLINTLLNTTYKNTFYIQNFALFPISLSIYGTNNVKG